MALVFGCWCEKHIFLQKENILLKFWSSSAGEVGNLTNRVVFLRWVRKPKSLRATKTVYKDNKKKERYGSKGFINIWWKRPTKWNRIKVNPRQEVVASKIIQLMLVMWYWKLCILFSGRSLQWTRWSGRTAVCL